MHAPLARALAACALLLSACASTELVESWAEPSIRTMPQFQKVFVAFVGGDAATRRTAEDAMAAELRETEVVKGYDVFPDSAPADAPAAIGEKLRGLGCDGAIVMRLARIEQELSYSPGSYPAHYRSFGPYWGWAHSPPPDVRTDEIAHVETNVYSLADDRLLYAARSETFNPGSTAGMVEEIAGAVREDMQEKGLLR